jgi:hypothetical protein
MTSSRKLASAKAVFLSLLFFVFAGAVPVARAQTFRGAIRGEVRDSSRQLLPGAVVTAKNLANGESRTTTTQSDGAYALLELPAGEYLLTVSGKGFTPITEKVLVLVGDDTTADLSFSQVASTSEVLTVTGQTPLLDTTRDVLGEVVDSKLVGELPLNGRDFGKLVALVPGVTVEGSGVAGTEKGFGQFNINGNRDRSNNYVVDGTDNNDPFFNNSALNQVGITGAPASLLPIDAIQEFNLQSQFGAEYGRNSGSVVNILTKSGKNQFHGSLFEFVCNDKFDARNFFNQSPDPKTAFHNNQFGGSLGGPIVHDRTFFFVAYEGQRERVGSNFILSVPTATQVANARAIASAAGPINPALDQILGFFPAPTGFNGTSGTVAGTVKDKNDLNSFIVKGDHQITNSESFSVRYAYSSSDQTFPLGSLGGFGAGSRLPQFAQESPTRVQVISASLLSLLSPSRINEVRFGYSRYRTSFRSIDDSFDPATIGLNNLGTGKFGLPEIDFSGLIENLGATAFSIPRGRLSQTDQILDNFSWLTGRHTLKFGGEFRRAAVDSFNDNLERGLLTFFPTGLDPDPVTDMLANFYEGNSFSQGNTGNTQRTTFNHGMSFFAQDDFRLRSNLTLNYGVRWEYFGPLSEQHNLLSNLAPNGNLAMVGTSGLDGAYRRDLNDFGPRFGFSWAARHATVLRGGYGIYYDYVPQNLLIANFTSSAGLVTNPVGPQAVLPLNFNQMAFANGAGAGNIFTMNTTGPFNVFVTPRSLPTPMVQNWNLNIQQQLGNAFVLETGYVGSKGTHLVRLFDANQTDANGVFPNPGFLAEDVFSSIANSTYHALQVTARLQGWHGLSGFSAYTYSKSLDDASDGIDFNFATAAFPQDSTNLSAEHGPSTFDTRHRFTLAWDYQVPVWSALPKSVGAGWELNSIITAQSGRPIPIVDSTDTSGRFNFHQRPNLVPGVDPILPNWNPSTGYLNPAAFTMPATGTFGNLGRNSIFGPHYTNVDFSVAKTTHVTEQFAVQFRAELFNVFNHPNFALPSNFLTPGTSPMGTITQTPDVAQGNPGLGGGGPRVIQLALKFLF